MNAESEKSGVWQTARSGENFLLEGLRFASPQGEDVLVVLAVPIQRVRGDLKAGGDAFDDPAFGAELDKGGSSLRVVHYFLGLLYKDHLDKYSPSEKIFLTAKNLIRPCVFRRGSTVRPRPDFAPPAGLRAFPTALIGLGLL